MGKDMKASDWTEAIDKLAGVGDGSDVHRDVWEWTRQLLDYSVVKKDEMNDDTDAGFSLYESLLLLTDKEHDEDHLKRTRILGLCVEIVCEGTIMYEDIVNDAETRSDKPCWFKLHNLGFKGINDAMLVSTGSGTLIGEYFGEEKYYSKLMEMFLDVQSNDAAGMALKTPQFGDAEELLELYTRERYDLIVRNTTAYRCYYFPLLLLMTVEDVFDASVERIAFKMGKFRHMAIEYDKYLRDDVESGCTWMAVEALARADNYQQCVILDTITQDPLTLREMYEKLNLPELLLKHAEEVHDDVMQDIGDLNNPRMRQVLLKMFNS